MGLGFLLHTYGFGLRVYITGRAPVTNMYETVVWVAWGAIIVSVILERLFGVGIFDPALGGDPVLFQHMFWIYSHPAVYIMILPAMGVVSEIIPTFARRTIL